MIKRKKWIHWSSQLWNKLEKNLTEVWFISIVFIKSNCVSVVSCVFDESWVADDVTHLIVDLWLKVSFILYYCVLLLLKNMQWIIPSMRVFWHYWGKYIRIPIHPQVDHNPTRKLHPTTIMHEIEINLCQLSILRIHNRVEKGRFPILTITGSHFAGLGSSGISSPETSENGEHRKFSFGHFRRHSHVFKHYPLLYYNNVIFKLTTSVFVFPSHHIEI
jgi:hypothetical protein